MKKTGSILLAVVALLLGACQGTTSLPGSDVPNALITADHSTRTVNQISHDNPQSTTPVTRVLTVKHYKTECEGFQVALCYWVREGEGPWELFYDSIEGFDYQWGFEYQILVEAISVEPTGLFADLNPGYRLLNVLETSEYQSGTDFEYVVRGGHEGVVQESNRRFTLHTDKVFECNPLDCQTLDSLLIQKQSVLLQFHHAQSPDAPLALAAILCADSPVSFYQSCPVPNEQL